MTKKMTIPAALLALAFASSSGCTNEVGEFLECAEVCEDYDDCVGGSFDATECTDMCEDYADLSEANEDALFECDECLDASADACTADCPSCSGIIPL